MENKRMVVTLNLKGRVRNQVLVTGNEESVRKILQFINTEMNDDVQKIRGTCIYEPDIAEIKRRAKNALEAVEIATHDLKIISAL